MKLFIQKKLCTYNKNMFILLSGYCNVSKHKTINVLVAQDQL